MVAAAGNEGVETGGGGSDGGDALGGARAGGGKGEGGGEIIEGFAGEAAMRASLLAKKQSAAEMEREKDRLQARCRELQVGKQKGHDCLPACVCACVCVMAGR